MPKTVLQFKQLKEGKIYFAKYEGGTEVVFRFKSVDTTRAQLFSHLHYWNRFESFHEGGEVTKTGVAELREASNAEKFNLVGHEIQQGVI